MLFTNLIPRISARGTLEAQLRGRNEPGDREKAMSLLDESLAISSVLGMRPLMERVLSRQDGLQA